MKTQNHQTKVMIFAALILALGAGACTKQRPYKKVPQDGINLMDKAVLPTEVDLLYVPSSAAASWTAEPLRTGAMGEGRIVRLRWTENALEVVQSSDDPMVSNRSVNTNTILSIPVEHKAFRCALNDNNECSNKEEENHELPWYQKPQFKADFAKMRVFETNTQDIALENLDKPCYKEIDSRYISSEMTNEIINIEVEKTYSADIECISIHKLEDLDKLTFKGRAFYSMIRLDKVTTGGYSPINYPEDDERKFGFFTTNLQKISSDGSSEVKGKIQYLNRWEPHRKNIVYHLSEEFGKPGNQVAIQATQVAVDAINKGLESANIDLRLSLAGPDSARPGDLRHSMIVMDEDPGASGLLGYGPSTTNPRTGEIVNGRVVMFYGNIKTMARRTYNELIEQKRASLVKLSQEQANATGLAQGKESGAPSKDLDRAHLRRTKGGSIIDGNVENSKVKPVHAAARSTTLQSVPSDSLAVAKAKQLFGLNSFVRSNISDKNSPKPKGRFDLGKGLVESHGPCAITEDDFNGEQAVSAAIDDAILKGKLEVSDLRPWDELSASEQKEWVDRIVPFVWVPILVHELGHTLGLRHNFAGSEDLLNFYTDEEAKKMGLDHAAVYSSVMDYSFHTTNELRTLGKYDIAALRFAYRREVEANVIGDDGTNSSKFVNVDELVAKAREKTPGLRLTPEEQRGGSLSELTRRLGKGLNLKAYKFCTDGNVGVNPGCKRFDEGTTYTEIAQQINRSYEEMYLLRNFRNGREHFSMTDDPSYFKRILGTLMDMRIFIEINERLRHYPVPEKEKEEFWNDPWVKDVVKAAQIATSFMLKVIMTPDVHCIVTDPKSADGPEIVPIANIGSGDLTTCFDPSLVKIIENINKTREKDEEKLTLEQVGKSFMSKKDPSNPNAYVDQIDVRGIWINKLLAANLLLTRELGQPAFDEQTDSVIDIPGMSEALQEIFSQILLDEVESVVPVQGRNGEAALDPVSKKPKVLKFKNSFADSHMIPSAHPALVKAFGLEEGQSNFSKDLLKIIRKETLGSGHNFSARPFVRAFYAERRLPNDGNPIVDGRKVITLGSLKFTAGEENTLALKIFDRVKAVQVLNKLDPVAVMLLYTTLKAPPADGKLPEIPGDAKVIEEAKKLPIEMFELFLDGSLKSEEFYFNLLEDMSD